MEDFTTVKRNDGGEINLSDDQRQTITHGLHIAVQKFEKNVMEIDGLNVEVSDHGVKEIHRRVKLQFQIQIADTLRLIRRIEYASFVKLGRVEE